MAIDVARLPRTTPPVTRSRGSNTERVLLTAMQRSLRDPAWYLQHHGCERAQELQVESRFAVSNGGLGVRASLECPIEVSSPRTYVAGLYDLRAGEPAVPTLVSAPDWARLELQVDGELVELGRGELLSHTRSLDLRHGLLWTEWQQRTPRGHTIRIRALRFVSLVERTLAVQAARIEVTPARGTRPRVWLTARVPAPHGSLRPVRNGTDLAVWETASSGRRLAMAWAPRLELNGRTHRAAGERTDEGLIRRWEWTAAAGRAATLLRPVAIVGQQGESDPVREARAVVRHARGRGLARVLDAHWQAWEARWAESDIQVQGDPYTQEGLRIAAYHLNAAANPENERVSIGARALTGDAYAGRVFWETEIYLLPFYIATQPAAARAALMYRYRTLPAARAKARRHGFRGAFYAWESASTGEEATPPMVFNERHEPIIINNGAQEQHISADVAWAAWHYWQLTADDAFFRRAGAEMILETARFWASRLEEGADGRLHIRTVIGPDEYHEGVDDDAYTNAMARWNLERGVEVAELLADRWPGDARRLRGRLRLTQTELERWRSALARIALDLDPPGRVIEQFAGYFDLEDVDLAQYEPRTVPMDVILGLERIRRSQVVKQPDVLMLLALFPDRVPPDVQQASFDYYDTRCGHGSSLSRGIHALVAARLGDTERAERHFRHATAIDLDDEMGNAAGGIHIGSLAGLWQAAVFGFGGLRWSGRGLALDPCLPASWGSLRFAVRWQGRRARIVCDAAARTVTVTLEQGALLPVRVGDVSHILDGGESWTASWPDTASPTEERAA